MTKINKERSSVNAGRREFLQFAGASAPVGAFGLHSGAANSQSLQGQAGFDEVLDIVIIGAGISGLTSARDLQRAGCESFMVLEARDRVGGRTLNSDVSKGQVTDVGGQWIGPGLVSQLDCFAEGTRKDPTGAMNVIAKVYSKDERESIASYLANLPTTTK